MRSVSGPLEQRVFQRRNVVIGGLLIVAFLIELVSSELHPAVWMLVVGLLVAGLGIGAHEAGRTVVDRYVADATRRRTEVVLMLGLVMAVAFTTSRLLDAGRNDGQAVLAVAGLAVVAFIVGYGAAVLRSLRSTGPG